MNMIEGDAPETEQEEAPPPPPPKPRPKMALPEQSAFLINLLRRCEMHSPEMKKVWAGKVTLALTEADMISLEVIQQTLAIFEMHGADELVRQKLWNEMKKRKKA